MFLFKSVPEDRKGRNVTKFSISIPKLYKNTTKRRKRQISFLMNIDMHIFQEKKSAFKPNSRIHQDPIMQSSWFHSRKKWLRVLSPTWDFYVDSLPQGSESIPGGRGRSKVSARRWVGRTAYPVFWVWHQHCTCVCTIIVLTYPRPSQDQATRDSSMGGPGGYEAPLLTEALLAVNYY